MAEASLSTIWFVARTTLTTLGLLVLWAILFFAGLEHQRPLALLCRLVGTTGLFLLAHAWVRGPRALRRLARLRVRPIGPWLPAVGIAVPAVLALACASVAAQAALVPIHPMPSGPLDVVRAQRLGWLPNAYVIAIAFPLLEEFMFRGWLQRALERQLGAPRAIGITAVVFGLYHVYPAQIPSATLFGLAAGYAVFVTRSIWAGVVLHVGNNAVVVLLTSLESEPHAAAATFPRGEVIAASLASSLGFAALGAALWVAYRYVRRRRGEVGPGVRALLGVDELVSLLRHPFATAQEYQARRAAGAVRSVTQAHRFRPTGPIV